MLSYTPELKLPKIVLLQSAEDDDRCGLTYRFIALHTPTGGIVEVLPGERLIPVKGSAELQFTETTTEGVKYYYTAILHNKANRIKAKDGRRAMRCVSRWFIKSFDEKSAVESYIEESGISLQDWEN